MDGEKNEEWKSGVWSRGNESRELPAHPRPGHLQRHLVGGRLRLSSEGGLRTWKDQQVLEVRPQSKSATGYQDPGVMQRDLHGEQKPNCDSLFFLDMESGVSGGRLQNLLLVTWLANN